MIQKFVKTFMVLGFLFFVFGQGAYCKETEKSTDDFYISEEFGFSIKKPPHWHFNSLGDALLNQAKTFENFKPDIEETTKYHNDIEQKTGMKPGIIAKYKEPSPSSNPSVTIVLHPMDPEESKNPLLEMKEYLTYFSNLMRFFQLVDRPKMTKISGFNATASQFTYFEATEDGKSIKNFAWILIVPKGDYGIFISVESELKDWSASKKYFQEIINSIKIWDVPKGE